MSHAQCSSRARTPFVRVWIDTTSSHTALSRRCGTGLSRARRSPLNARGLFSAPSVRVAALWLERVVRASPSHSRLELCRRRRVPTISLTGRDASRHEAEAHASFGFDPLHEPDAYAQTNGRITGCATKVSNPPKLQLHPPNPQAAVCSPQRRLPQLGQEMAPLSDGRTCVVGETS